MILNACSLLAVATAYRYAPMLQPGGAASSPQALVMSLLLSCALTRRGFTQRLLSCALARRGFTQRFISCALARRSFTQSLLLSLSYAYAVAGRGFVI